MSSTPNTAAAGPVIIEALRPERFAPFGDIIDCQGEPDWYINEGRCARHHDLARLDFAAGGRAGISVFAAPAYQLPHQVSLVERHPLGSQAFLPLSAATYLVVVADDDNGRPGRLHAFLAGAEQGVNLHRNVWHGVLTPLRSPARFAVVDWIGNEANLETWPFAPPVVVREA